jgi:hypothetical protein
VSLRAVDDASDGVPESCATCAHELLEAVRSGSVLDMLQSQRRLMARGLLSAEPNTAPQFNQALNKLHELIAAEESRLTAEAEAEEQEGPRVNDDDGADPAFDPSTV